jgi:hypothetical protein
MSKTFECESDCPPVERVIWGKVAVDCGDFAGVRELTFADLCELKGVIDMQLAHIFKNSVEG